MASEGRGDEEIRGLQGLVWSPGLLMATAGLDPDTQPSLSPAPQPVPALDGWLSVATVSLPLPGNPGRLVQWRVGCRKELP